MSNDGYTLPARHAGVPAELPLTQSAARTLAERTRLYNFADAEIATAIENASRLAYTNLEPAVTTFHIMHGTAHVLQDRGMKPWELPGLGMGS